MRTNRKIRKKKKRKKKLILLFFIVAVIVVAVGGALYQSQRDRPRPTAEEYFEISDVTHEGFFEENSSLLVVHRLTFNLTVVGGDAHHVVVQNLGPDEPSAWHEPFIDLGTMLQGEVEPVTLSTEYGLYIHLKEKGFPVEIRVTSEETSKDPKDQFITIYLTPDTGE